MRKEEFIVKYGKEKWGKYDRKGNNSYNKRKEYNRSGLRGERNRVRAIDRGNWITFKKIIDKEGVTQVHHLWKNGSAEYFGIAIVDTTFTHIHEDCDVMLDLEFNSCAKLGKCELCGWNGRTHWHHPDGRQSVLAMFSCLEVCPKCHKAIEHMRVEQVIAFQKGIKRGRRNG